MIRPAGGRPTCPRSTGSSATSPSTSARCRTSPGHRNNCTRCCSGPEPAVFAHVAEHEGGIAGFALWFLNFSTWQCQHGLHLEDLYVRPELRGHGYGRQLLTELAALCVQRGYGRLEWVVLDWNEPAIGFYRALGAVGMDEWTTFRLTGPALAQVAAARGGG